MSGYKYCIRSLDYTYKYLPCVLNFLILFGKLQFFSTQVKNAVISHPLSNIVLVFGVWLFWQALFMRRKFHFALTNITPQS